MRMRFVADVWAIAQMSLEFKKTEVLFMAEKSQDLYRKAGLNTASTGKMSTKQATNKLGAGQTREYSESQGTEMISFIFAYRKADNTLAVHLHGDTRHFSTADFSKPDDYHIDLDMWNYSMGQIKDIRDKDKTLCRC